MNSCILGFFGVVVGSRWRGGSVCAIVGNVVRGVGGCCWAGRGSCIVRVVFSFVFRYIWRRRCRV